MESLIRISLCCDLETANNCVEGNSVEKEKHKSRGKEKKEVYNGKCFIKQKQARKKFHPI